MSSQTYTGTVIQDQPSKPKKSSPNASQSNSDTGLIKYIVTGKESATIIYLVGLVSLNMQTNLCMNLDSYNTCM